MISISEDMVTGKVITDLGLPQNTLRQFAPRTPAPRAIDEGVKYLRCFFAFAWFRQLGLLHVIDLARAGWVGGELN
jgi:hypothetical protein